MKLLLFIISALMWAKDSNPAPEITAAQLVTYQTARADFAEAQLVLAAKQKALEAIVKELQAVCPLTTNSQTGQPMCAPKSEPKPEKEPAK